MAYGSTLTGASGNSGGYNGGPVDQSGYASIGVFGSGAQFGMNSSGWTIATSGSSASGQQAVNPWLIGGGLLVVGFVLWKSLRK